MTDRMDCQYVFSRCICDTSTHRFAQIFDGGLHICLLQQFDPPVQR
jgi:hypothetical protein